MRGLLFVLLLASAPAARAHAILMESQPAVRGSVPPGSLGIVLRYNSRIDAARSRLLLIRADHGQSVLALDNADAVDRLSAHAVLEPGDYVLRWQVLATDGHITRGDVPFTVVPAPVALDPQTRPAP